MNKLDYFMYFMAFVLLSTAVYVGYHNGLRIARWNFYATSQGCEYIGRSLEDYRKILIDCNSIIHVESAKTYGLPQ